MMKKLALLIAVCAVIFSCKKEVTVPNNGIYRGVFREYASNGDTLAEGLVFLAMFEENQTFSMVGDSSSFAPATHTGTYLVDNATNMQFTNSTVYNPSYDPDHYLDTIYSYKFDDVTFEFEQTILGKRYEYVLTRN